MFRLRSTTDAPAPTPNTMLFHHLNERLISCIETNTFRYQLVRELLHLANDLQAIGEHAAASQLRNTAANAHIKRLSNESRALAAHESAKVALEVEASAFAIKVQAARTQAATANAILSALIAKCPHQFRHEHYAHCTLCRQDFGYRCAESPDGVCHCESNSDGHVTTIFGTPAAVPIGYSRLHETGHCIFCKQQRIAAISSAVEQLSATDHCDWESLAYQM